MSIARLLFYCNIFTVTKFRIITDDNVRIRNAKSCKISLSIEPPYKKTSNIFYGKENGKGMKSTRKSSLKFFEITCLPKWSPKVFGDPIYRLCWFHATCFEQKYLLLETIILDLVG